LALDMLYDINQNNSVNAYLEVGLPSYTATGDQPYRFDWEHPKSVEDSSGVGSAFHLGLGANWTTALTDNVALSVGVTYDYYTVSDADAKTYLNGEYYNDIYNQMITLSRQIVNGYCLCFTIGGRDDKGSGAGDTCQRRRVCVRGDDQRADRSDPGSGKWRGKGAAGGWLRDHLCD
jgi:hypothetical protein